jgi:hypothetical protein
MLPQDIRFAQSRSASGGETPVGRLFRDSGKDRSHHVGVDMGSNFDRSNGSGACASSAAPAKRDQQVPDFRGLLRKAAADLRAEAAGRARAEDRERLTRLATILEGYAEDGG